MCSRRVLAALKTVLLASLLAAALPTAVAMEVGFGYLGKDQVIDRIMYYQKGEWQKPLSAFLTATGQFSSGMEPHDAIVNAWLKAHSGAALDCAQADLRQYDASHCLYTKKLNRSLNAISAEELSAFLISLPPRTRAPVDGERAQTFTPDHLTRLLAWKALKSDRLDEEDYAKLFWGTAPSAFTQWFDMNQPDVSVTPPRKNLFTDLLSTVGLRQSRPPFMQSSHALWPPPSQGDCHAGIPGIKLQAAPQLTPREGWVATQKWGYRWIPFEKMADLDFDPVSGAAAATNVELPLPFASLLQHVKTNWEAGEARTVPHKLKLGPLRRLELQKRLGTTPFRKLTVERAVSYQNRWALLLFYGEKSYRLPQTEGPPLDIYFRAWAIRHPEGRTEWIASRIDLDPAAAAIAHVDETIIALSPHALLEIDGKQFVITASNLQRAKSTTLRTEVFELVNYQFKSRGVYGGACGSAPAAK